MKYKIFIGIIVFSHSENHLTLESFLAFGKTKSEAEKSIEKYARKSAKKLSRKTLRTACFAIEQKHSEIEHILNFAKTGFLSDRHFLENDLQPKRTRRLLERDKKSLNIGGKIIEI